MKKINILIFALLLSVISGCGEIDKKEVSKENFKRVLNDYYARNCVAVVTGELPRDVNPKAGMFSNPMKILESLERVGLVKSENIKMKADSLYGKKRLVDGKRFTLTEKGSKIYKKLRYTSGLCVAKRTIATIDNYTTPANMAGMTMVRVNFTFNPLESTDLLKEIMKEELLSKGIAKEKKKKSTRAELILTEMKGWIHQRDFKQ